jgi:transporter family protein
VVFALGSALFAALTSIPAETGVESVNSNLATAVRTTVALVMAWGIVFMTGRHHEVVSITQKSWIFLSLSGLATGASWLFYYRALQMADASKVVPIDKFSVVISMVLAFVILGKAVTWQTVVDDSTDHRRHPRAGPLTGRWVTSRVVGCGKQSPFAPIL